MIRMASWEGLRWLSPWMFSLLVAVSALTYVLNLYSDEMFRVLREQGFGESALNYLVCYSGGGPLSSISLCCVVLLGTGLYAQDYEESTVYMRIQRMGMKCYAALRVLQTCISSFLVGCFSILLAIPLVAVIFHTPLFVGSQGYDVLSSQILESGNVLAYLAAYGSMFGFRAMFYALLTFLLSIFVPRKRVLVAVPALLWYINQYVLSGIEWIPLFLQPFWVFNITTPLNNLDGLTEWETLWCVALALLVLAVVIWGVLVVKLRRTGIFGGEQSE